MKKITRILAVFLAAVLFAGPFGLLSATKAQAASGQWVAAWATSLVNGSINLNDYVSGASFQDIIPARSTIRIETQLATGGSLLKFKFSNQYGVSSMTISEASVAKTDTSKSAKIQDGTQCQITFDGQTSVTIPAGGTIWSDAVKMDTEALEKISLSLYFKNATYITSTGLSNGKTFLNTKPFSLLSSNPSQCNNVNMNSASEINITSSTITYHTIPFLANITTFTTESNACSAVFIGDSTLVNDTYLYFARKLVEAGCTNIGVINEAVIGNKLLSDGTGLIGNLYGQALIDRFERDVLSIDSVRYVFVKIGLNDVLHQFSKSLGASTPKYTVQEIISGYESLISMAHAKGIKIYFFTKSAWKGYTRSFLGQTADLDWSQEAQDMCDGLNNWVKTNTRADGYIDCSPLADPSDTRQLCPTFTLDGAHLTDLGSIALADLIPLSFVDVGKTNAKTAAEIMGVNPYKEKEQILADMANPKPVESTTAAPEEKTTAKQNETTTKKPDSSVGSNNTTGAVQNNTDATAGDIQPYTTQPFAQNTEPYSSNINSDVVFNVEDENTPTSIGSGTHIGLILIVFLVIVVAGAVVFLTLGKKKEEF